MSKEPGVYDGTGTRNTPPRKAMTLQAKRRRDAIGRRIAAGLHGSSPIVYDADTGKVRDDCGTIVRLFYGKDDRLRFTMYSLDYFRTPLTRLCQGTKATIDALDVMF